MSILDSRNAIKNLTTLNVDFQYLYKLGLTIFNADQEKLDIETHEKYRIASIAICNDLEKSILGIKNSLTMISEEIINIPSQ